jgi:nickel/cobalt exporter
MIEGGMFPMIWLLIATAWAHPFGSNLFGHKTEVRLEGDRVEVDYLAEIPTPVLLRELKSFLADIEAPTQSDQDLHTETVLADLTDGLRLLVDGERLEWTRLESPRPSGVGDTRFIGYNLRLAATLPEGVRGLNLVNGNRPDETALFSTEVFVAPGVILDATSQIDVDDHGHIESNRGGAWRGDESGRELRMSFRVRTELGAAVHRQVQRYTSSGAPEFAQAVDVLSSAEPDVLPSLVKGELTPRGIWVALMMALVLGAAHAFAPGHGKALVAAYLLGERRTYRHALILGGIVTVTHTITVFVLGGVALMLSEVLPPEQLLPWMELASGLLVLGVGLQLVRVRLFGSVAGEHEHSHDHEHTHDHSHDHAHAHGEQEEAHAAAHAGQYAHAATPKDLIALGISGGIAPCPSALVLLLTAISFHRILFGLVLVTVFSAGLALVVSAVGIVVIRLGDTLRSRVDGHFVSRVLPAFSAVVIAIVGAGITAKGVGSVLSMIGG